MGLHERITTEKAWQHGPSISDGEDAERSLFGAAKIPRNEADHLLPFEAAVEYAKQHQPDPTKRSKLIKQLRAKVAELCGDITVPVKFYTAVGTSLDIHHGVDAFFEQDGRLATLDVSLRDKPSHKADILLYVSFKDDGSLQIEESEVQRVAQAAAELLNQKALRRAA